MGELLNVLLDVSTLESGSVEPQKRNVKVSEILDKIVVDNTQQAEAKGLQFECDAFDCVIYSDPALLQRVIENFVTNAIRYTEQGTITIQCESHGGNARISVKDMGIGIPEESLDKVFDEFYQLDNSVRDRRKGFGLGLSIVKHIARLLEHNLNVFSTFGEGLTFSVDVPLGESIDEVDDHSPIVSLSPDHRQEPIVLIVDDELAIVDSMQELLSAFDLHVVTAENGPQAVGYIENGLIPDLIISDYRMPAMTGVETVTKIRAMSRQDLPVVIMTGDTSAKKIKDANLSHCTIMDKPVNLDQLLTLIEAIKG